MLFCINTEFRGLKLQTHLSRDVLFIGCGIFPQVIYLHLIRHVVNINIYQWPLQVLTIKQIISMKTIDETRHRTKVRYNYLQPAL